MNHGVAELDVQSSKTCYRNQGSRHTHFPAVIVKLRDYLARRRHQRALISLITASFIFTLLMRALNTEITTERHFTEEDCHLYLYASAFEAATINFLRMALLVYLRKGWDELDLLVIEQLLDVADVFNQQGGS